MPSNAKPVDEPKAAPASDDSHESNVESWEKEIAELAKAAHEAQSALDEAWARRRAADTRKLSEAEGINAQRIHATMKPEDQAQPEE